MARQKRIKDAVGELIGPTEIAPEVMGLIKSIETNQKGILLKV